MYFRTWLRSMLCLPMIPRRKAYRQKDRKVRARLYRDHPDKRFMSVPKDHVGSFEVGEDWPDGAADMAKPSKELRLRLGSSALSDAPFVKDKEKGERMGPDVVRQVIDGVGEVFYFFPYAVAGYAALTQYGWDMCDLKHVSIVCPPESLKPARCWAITKRLEPVPNEKDVFKIRIPDGTFHRIKIRVPVQAYKNVGYIRMGPSDAAIMTLPSIADDIARAYIHALHGCPEGKQAEFARDMCWTLHRIIRSPHEWQQLTIERAPNVYNKSFWLPFTLSFPESVALFGKAGLELRDDGYASSATTLVEGQLPRRRTLRKVTARLSVDTAESYRAQEDLEN